MAHRSKTLVVSIAAALTLTAAASASAQPAPPTPPTPPASSSRTAPPAPPMPPGPHARPPADRDASGPMAGPARPDGAGPMAGPARHDAAGPATTLTGRVVRWLPNPNGEVDGLLLDDGTQVAFPPHLSARVLAAVKLRDSVQITGRRGMRGGVVHAASLRNTASGTSVSDDGPGAAPAARPPARDHAALTAMTATGRIVTLLHTGRGDVNGAVLDDGTVLRFPPPAARQMSASLTTGGTLFASGYGTRSSQGNAFEATRMGTSASDAQAVLAGPHGPAGHGPRDPAGHGPDAPAGHGPEANGPGPGAAHPDGARQPDDGGHAPHRAAPGADGSPPPPAPGRPDAASAPR